MALNEMQLHRVRTILGGRNSTASEPLVKEDESPDDLNVETRPIGVLTKRAGFERYIPTNFGTAPSGVTGLHKLYRKALNDEYLLVFVGTNLYAVDVVGTRTTLKNDFTVNTFMDFATLKNLAYCTNFADLPQRTDGVTITEAELLRPDFPNQQYGPVGAAGSGDMDNGFYFYRARAFWGDDLGESGWAVDFFTVPITGELIVQSDSVFLGSAGLGPITAVPEDGSATLDLGCVGMS